MSFVLARPKAGVAPRRSRPASPRRPACAHARAEAVRVGLHAATTSQNTGIPVNFGITIALALLVGDRRRGADLLHVHGREPEAVRRAQGDGVTNTRLVGMILLQASAVGVIGFAIGSGLAATFFEITLRKSRRGGSC